MKIAFIGGRDIRSIGGIENYMYNLTSELVKSGYEPIVYCESDANKTEEFNGITVIYQKSVGGRLCKIILGLKATLDVVLHHRDAKYVHYNAWPPSVWSWIASLFGHTVILQGHGLEWKRTKYTSFQQKMMHLMEWFTAKTHKNITVVSDEQREYFAKAYGRRAVTIPTAVHIPVEKSDTDILSRYGLEPDGYFLFLGRLIQDKNPDTLIKAYLQSGITDKKLVIAGDNNFMPKYPEYLKSLAAGCDRIIFTGAVYGDDKETLHRRCFAFCLPSTIEGLSIVLLEAMSYGKICIASDIPANHEALGNEAVWVEPENTDDLERALHMVDSRYKDLLYLGENNRHRVARKFTWDKIARQYETYLQTRNTLSRQHELLLELLRCAMFGTTPEALNFEDLSDSDWREIYTTAVKQGVLALAFDGVKRLPKESQPPFDVKIQWGYNIERASRRYETSRKALHKLAQLLGKHGMETMVIKGYGMSLYYPTPSQRHFGDIDIYLFDRFDDATQALRSEGIKIDDSYYRHYEFFLDGINVESHRLFVETRINDINNNIETELQALALESSRDTECPEIRLPSPDFNALYLARHSSWHFARESISLRDLCDWTLFLTHEATNIDMDAFMRRIRENRLEKFVSIITDICREHLGLQVELPVAEHYPDLCRRVMDDILSFDNTLKYAKYGPLKKMAVKSRVRLKRKWCYDEVGPDRFYENTLYSARNYILHPKNIFKKRNER